MNRNRLRAAKALFHCLIACLILAGAASPAGAVIIPGFSGGSSGTSASPYIIKTALDMYNVRYYLGSYSGWARRSTCLYGRQRRLAQHVQGERWLGCGWCGACILVGIDASGSTESGEFISGGERGEASRGRAQTG